MGKRQLTKTGDMIFTLFLFFKNLRYRNICCVIVAVWKSFLKKVVLKEVLYLIRVYNCAGKIVIHITPSGKEL